MSELKFVLWNMEWLNDLFYSDSSEVAFKKDTDHVQHAKGVTVKARRDDLYGVLSELDPDILVVVEGPSRPGELELFFETHQPGQWTTGLQKTRGSQQNIGIAVKNAKIQALTLHSDEVSGTFKSFLFDTDDDSIQEKYTFERLPLFAEVKINATVKLNILGLHLKSKGIFDAIEWSKWWSKADSNRRKILAEASQVRREFIDKYLEEEETKSVPLIVCGDINDGPGFDASEKRLLGSGIEKLMGSVWEPEKCLGNAIFDAQKDSVKKKLNFSKIYTTSFKDPIFNDTYQRDWIDHILYSRNVAKQWVGGGRIHAKMNGNIPIWKKYKHSSDHFPVSVMISL